MRPIKTRLLSSTVIPFALAAGVAIVTAPETPGARANQQVAANPCAAKRSCNPCAAKRACNPYAAKRACNPCAAKGACNPCNPCAGGAASYSSACVVPRLVAANSCAAKRGCNPCAAKRACNPCAAKRACNPCAAKRVGNPCNPCGAAAEVKLTAGEAVSVYNCLKSEMKTAYAKSGNLWAKWFQHWKKFSTRPYASSTHGGRFVTNYASKKAAGPYGKFEKVGKMAVGGVLAKDSFSVTPQGRVSVGPLFLMEKMGGGFNKASGNWRYTMIMPSGQTVGTTNGKGSNNVKFCIECHAAVAQEQDAMFFIPSEYRTN